MNCGKCSEGTAEERERGKLMKSGMMLELRRSRECREKREANDREEGGRDKRGMTYKGKER